jgi:hypothetical protein
MPANFPINPTLNQVYTFSGSTWTWSGSTWLLTSTAQITGATGATGAGVTLTAVASHVIPAANVTYDLGTNSLRWRDLYLSGNSLYIGGATLTATGSAIALPAGSTVGGQSVASGGDVATGGGPKITNLQITSNVYVVLDDTAVDLTGGFVKLTGTNFVSGCLVYVASTPANSTTFINSTEVRAQLPATAAGTYPVYLVNPDGGTAIRVPGVTFSASPAWQTASSLGEQYDGVVLTLPVVATDATVYTLTSGSLPPGLSLNSNTGVISGTVSGVANDTVYSFTITATDAQLQDSPRTFTVTITVSDPYFKLTTLLLSASAISANTVVRDSSTNNFNLTVFGDARASNFTPYGTGWSVQFDGNGDYLSIPTNAALNLSSGDFTIEGWVHWTGSNAGGTILNKDGVSGSSYPSYLIGLNSSGYFRGAVGSGNGTTYFQTITSSVLAPTNQWVHLAFVKNGTTLTLYQNGTNVGSATQTGTIVDGAKAVLIGYETGQGSTVYWSGYVSNTRIVKGTAVYTANFTPATTNLTSVANTSLLTCHVNSFRDASTNNFTVTPNGDARVVSFNPFNITNTGVNGSMYFDGTGDYVQIANSANLAVGAGDFTIECWVNTSTFSVDTYYRRVFTFGPDAANNLQLLFFDGTNAVSTLNVYSNTILINGTITVANGAWHHVAVCRSGTSLKLFVDGVQSGSTATTSQNFDSAATNGLYIGRFSLAGGHFLGFMSDFRVVKGTALYTTTFTPPTSPLTAVANTQLLTLQYDQPHNNHTFLDSSSNQFLITRSGNATQGTFSPFSNGGWSNYYTGNQSIYANNAAFAVGTGNFTVELFYNPSAWAGTTQRIFVIGQSGTDGVTIQRGSGSNVVEINISASGVTNVINYTWNPNIGQWYHIALVRSGTGTNQTALYIDGVSVATGTSTASMSSTQLSVGGINWVANYGTQGYISNVRFSSVARVITVPTAPYTSDANTLLLTCQSNRFVDNSPTPKTLTLQNSPSVQAFSPFAATAVYNPVIHGGSAYFDGTGDYCLVSDSPLFSLAAADFTIESWIYKTASGRSEWFGQCDSAGTSASASFDLQVTAGGKLSCGVFSGATSYFATSTADFPLNSWTHVVLCRDGTTIRQYINGVQDGTSSIGTASVNDASTNLGIGRLGDFTSNYLTGYMSSTRIIRGQCLYPSGTTFTPPTAPPTATTNTSLLVNFTDAAIIDSTGRQVLETVADVKSSSVITKFTGASIYFDGTGDYVRFPTSERFQLLAGSSTTFTIEAWIYKLSNPSSGNQYPLITTLDIQATYYGYYFSISDAGKLIFSHYYNGNNQVASRIGNTALASSAWYHVALVASAGTFKIYVNGIEDAPYSDTNAASLGNTSQQLATAVATIGGPSVGAPSWQIPFNGYISDFRVTRGYARYTTNFTAPTAPARLK